MQKPLPFPELEEERDRAERVKQDTPVLVIIGNPPYNGFAGVAVDEERELSQAYRSTRMALLPRAARAGSGADGRGGAGVRGDGAAGSGGVGGNIAQGMIEGQFASMI